MILICVFCETTYPDDAVICAECNNYKGMMPLEEAMETYDFIKEKYEEEN